ncbi:MAG: hypothetical protein IKD79_01665 [Oscillospiraceae bacterium]|nr:hypothetical protein [Oscillospiraceae bacterium]
MIHVSDAFRAAMASRRNFTRTAAVTLADGTELTLENDEFTIAGSGYADSAGGGTLPVGAALCRTAQLELVNSDGRWDGVDFQGAEIVLTLGFDTGVSVESFPVGTFTVRQPGTYGTAVILSAVDAMYRAEHYFETALTYPAAAQAVLEEACENCGIDYDAQAIPAGSYMIRTAPSSELTYRQVLGYIAMLSGGNARVSRTGRLEIVHYDFAGLAALREGYTDFTDDGRGNVTGEGNVAASDDGHGNLTVTGSLSAVDDGDGGVAVLRSIAAEWHELGLWKELESDREDVTITGIETAVQTAGGGTEILLEGQEGNVLAVYNPLIAGNEAAALAFMGAALIGAAYRPFRGEHVAYPLAEFGDLCRVSDGRGRSFCSLITDMDFQWNSFTSLEASSEAADGSAAATLSQKVTRLAADWARIGTVITDNLQAAGIDADWINAGALTIRDGAGHVIFKADAGNKSVQVGGMSAAYDAAFDTLYILSGDCSLVPISGNGTFDYDAKTVLGTRLQFYRGDTITGDFVLGGEIFAMDMGSTGEQLNIRSYGPLNFIVPSAHDFVVFPSGTKNPTDARRPLEELDSKMPVVKLTGMSENTLAALTAAMTSNNDSIPLGPSVVYAGDSSVTRRAMVTCFKTNSTLGRGTVLSAYAINGSTVTLSAGGWS